MIDVEIFSERERVRVRNVLQPLKLLKYRPSRLLKTLQTGLPYLDHGVERGENRSDKKQSQPISKLALSGRNCLASILQLS